jgi:hypothetical protein
VDALTGRQLALMVLRRNAFLAAAKLGFGYFLVELFEFFVHIVDL